MVFTVVTPSLSTWKTIQMGKHGISQRHANELPHLKCLCKGKSFEIKWHSQSFLSFWAFSKIIRLKLLNQNATVGHTFFDVIRNTLLQEALNTPLSKYLTVQSDVGETKQFFSRSAKQRKEHLLQFYKTRMQNIHLTMCKSEQYLSLLTDKSGQIVYDSTLYLKDFDSGADKVSIEFVASVSHIFTEQTIVFP